MSLSDPSPFQPFLNRLLSRSKLNEAEQGAILSLPGTPMQVQINRDFVRLGERVDHACFVIGGLVGRFGQNRDGKRQITALHIAGDMVDLHSVVIPKASSALQALSVATILRVPHRALREVAHVYPTIAEAFWRECVVDAAILSEWVVNVGRRSALLRTAHLLCEVACRTRSVHGNSFTFDFAVTQAHLGDMLGLTSVHVNRVLRMLKDDQLAIVQDRQVRVLDWSRLVQTGEFNADYLHLMPLPDGPQAELQPTNALRR